MSRILPFLTILVLLQIPAATAQQTPAADAPRPPPPRLRVPREDGVIYSVEPGTIAPDGVGATVKSAVWAGHYDTEILTYVPWQDDSIIQPLSAGASIPQDSVVRTMSGEPFSLNEAVRDNPTVLMFYRGGWCPYCNAHLRDLQETEAELQQLGYQILAVSTDTPDEIREFNADKNFSYTLLSDDKLEVAAKFGLRYKVVQEYLDHVANLDLPAKNGGYLLTPGAFIVDRQGVIRFAYANNNYSVRVSYDSLMQAARDALQD